VNKSLINKILIDREKRYNKILDLLKKFKMDVVCGKINYPGNNKNSKEVEKAFRVLLNKVKKSFSQWAIYLDILSGDDGPAVLMVVDKDAFEAKKLALIVEEETGIGRVFDVDIYKVDGTSVSRRDLKLPERRCLLCQEDGRICTRLGKHSVDEVLEKINNIIEAYGEAND
jgi:holo-ACP synthase